MNRSFVCHKTIFPAFSTEEKVTCVSDWLKANCMVFASWSTHYAAKLCFFNEKTLRVIKVLMTTHLKSIIQVLVVKYKRISYIISAGKDSQVQVTLANRGWKTHGVLIFDGALKKIVYARKKNLIFGIGKFKGIKGFFLN